MSAPSFSVEPCKCAFSIYHRKKTNCALDVTTDFCSEIGEPQLLKEGWAVPCDVVGLGTKKAKSVKIRYHPSVRQLCAKNPKLHEAACRDALKYLDTLLEDSEWTRKMEKAEVRYASLLEKVAEELDVTRTIVDVTSDSIIVSWCFSDKLNTTSMKKQRKSSSTSALAFFNSFSHSLQIRLKEMDENATEVSLVFEKEDFSQPIVKLIVDTDFINKYKKDAVLADVKCVQGLVMWSVKRCTTDEVGVPQSLPATLDYQLKVADQWKHAEASINQMLLKRLKREVDESLDALAKSALSQNLAVRILNIIKNPMGTPAQTLVEVTQAGGTPRINKLTAQATGPLNISIDNLDSLSESDNLATSPAESIDSGVSLSPISSPIAKSFGAAGIRERSYSESTWGLPLKGILKRSNRWDRFCRSVSECLEDDPTLSPTFMPRSPTIETSDDEDVIDKSTDDSSSPISHRKKRVSFSENLYSTQFFKSTQSIESQKRKNQKKRDQKKRKEDSKLYNAAAGRVFSDSCDELFDEAPGPRTNREDSGFVDADDNDTWQSAVRRVRLATN